MPEKFRGRADIDTTSRRHGSHASLAAAPARGATGTGAKQMIQKLSPAFVLGIVMAALLTGCEHRSPAAKGKTYHYALRGSIVALPVAGQGPPQLQISTKPIAHWVRMSGKVGTMPAMVMPYQLAAGVSVKGFSIGEKIVCRYEVNWQRDIAQITAIRAARAGLPTSRPANQTGGAAGK